MIEYDSDMIVRVLIAAVGALIVTAGLLLSMDAVTSLFREGLGERYFRITDILPKPDPGRPERPAPQARQPLLPEAEFSGPDATLTIEAPAIDSEARELVRPQIGLDSLEITE